MAYRGIPNSIAEKGFSHISPGSTTKLLPVKDQLKCDSCLHVQCAELAGVVYSKLMGNARHIRLSAQELLDKVKLTYPDNYPNPDDGPLVQDELNYLKFHGICREAVYPYRAKQNPSPPDLSRYQKFRVTESYQIPNLPGYETDFEEMIREYPVIGVMKIWNDFNYLPAGGAYRRNASQVGPGGDHAVMIIGYGVVYEDGELINVYEVKNSHGDAWSNGGYGFVERSFFDSFVLFETVVAGPPM